MAKFEEKYLVVKWDDIYKYTGSGSLLHLRHLLTLIAEGRESEGKSPNSYIVCNRDEPYANDILQLILKEETVVE